MLLLSRWLAAWVIPLSKKDFNVHHTLILQQWQIDTNPYPLPAFIIATIWRVYSLWLCIRNTSDWLRHDLTRRLGLSFRYLRVHVLTTPNFSNKVEAKEEQKRLVPSSTVALHHITSTGPSLRARIFVSMRHVGFGMIVWKVPRKHRFLFLGDVFGKRLDETWLSSSIPRHRRGCLIHPQCWL